MNASRVLALLFLILTAIWLWSGQWPQGQALEEIPSTDGAQPEKPLTTVRAIMSEAIPYVRTITVRGQTEADRRVDVRSQIDAKVTKIAIARGEVVEKDQLLVQLATDDRLAILNQAQAVVTQRELEYQAAVRLNEKGFRAETSTAQAKAALQIALADQRRAEILLSNTRILAPFDGIVETLPVELGAFVEKGGTVATIVDRNPMIVVANISEREINNVAVGSKARARLVDGTRVDGVITFVGQTAEMETRTFRVEMETPNTTGALRDGMTSELQLPVEHTRAHFLTPAILALGDDGTLGVRTVDDNDIVRFVKLTIVGNSPKGIWVTGLGSSARVISVGQEFVVPGERVDVDMDVAGGGS